MCTAMNRHSICHANFYAPKPNTSIDLSSELLKQNLSIDMSCPCPELSKSSKRQSCPTSSILIAYTQNLHLHYRDIDIRIGIWGAGRYSFWRGRRRSTLRCRCRWRWRWSWARWRWSRLARLACWRFARFARFDRWRFVARFTHCTCAVSAVVVVVVCTE